MRLKKENTIAFLSVPPKELFGLNQNEETISKYNTLKNMIYKEIKNLYLTRGYKNFITDGERGTSQLVFIAVHKLKQETKDERIKNIIYSPWINQNFNWIEKGLFSKEVYNTLLENADDVEYINEETRCDLKAVDKNYKKIFEQSGSFIFLYPDDTWKTRSDRLCDFVKNAYNQHREVMQFKYDKNNILSTLHLADVSNHEKIGVIKCMDKLYEIAKQENDGIFFETDNIETGISFNNNLVSFLYKSDREDCFTKEFTFNELLEKYGLDIEKTISQKSKCHYDTREM